MRYFTLLGLLLLLTGANWLPDGVPVVQTAGDQSAPTVADDGGGGLWVVWRDDSSALTGPDIYARHVSAAGTPLGPAGGLAICTAGGAQTSPTVVADGLGGCFIAWTDGRETLSGPDIFMQRLDASGAPQWHSNGTAVIVTFGEQSAPRIGLGAYFGFYVVWQDARSGGANFDIYAQHFNDFGLPTWTAPGVVICAAPGNQRSPAVLPDGVGGIVTAWVDRRSGVSDDIYAQRVPLSGAVLWSAGGVPVCTASGDQEPLAGPSWLAEDGGGGLFLAWTDHRAASQPNAYLQRIAHDGARAAGWPADGLLLCPAAGTRAEPTLAGDGAGGVLAAWLDARSGSTDRCYVTRRRGDGALAAGFPVDGLQLCVWPGSKSTLALAPDGEGGARAVWVTGSGGAADLDGQWVSGGGALLGPGSGVHLCAAADAQSAPGLTDGTAGDLLFAWSDRRSAATSQQDIYAGRFSAALGNLTAKNPPPGFATSIVPTTTPGATPAGVTASPVLPGNAPSTWLNAAYRVEAGGLAGWQSLVKLDGETVSSKSIAEGQPPGAVTDLNLGPLTVPGGRHTLSLELDPARLAAESNEGDNSSAAQWVWSPLTLDTAGPLLRNAPPNPGLFAEPNCDGFAFAPAAGRAWLVAAVSRVGSDDVNLIAYDDYTGSGAGFSHRRATSDLPESAVDLIVGQRDATPAPFYPAVCRGSGLVQGNTFIIEAQDAAGHASAQVPAVWPAQSFGAGRLARIYEVYLQAGQECLFRLVREQGLDPLALALFAGDEGAVAPRSAAVDTASVDEQGSAYIDYFPDSAGWYSLVVFRPTAQPEATALGFSLYALAGSSAVADASPGLPPAVRLQVGNPARSRVAFSLGLPAGPATLDLFDVRGRLVRHLLDGAWRSAGPLELQWDGLDESGQPAASGAYRARLVTSQGRLERGFIRLR